MRQIQPAFHQKQPGIPIPRNSLWIALLWFVALLLSLTGAPQNRQTLPPSVENAHAFDLATLDGSRLALADLRGRWILVNFWATWCLPCREEMAFLQELAVANPEKLVVLGVNMRESSEDVRAFLADTGVSFPILLDPDDGTLLAYDVRGLPLTAVIGPDGALLDRIVGPMDPNRFSIDTLLYPSNR